MKRIFLTIIISLVIGVVAYAQQATTTTQPAADPSATAATSQGAATGTPSAAQTKQSAQTLLDQANTNSTQYSATLASLQTQNVDNTNAATLARLTNELNSIEANINAEETAIKTNLDKGSRLNPEVISGLQTLINQHKDKMTEIQNFIQSIQN